MDGMDGIVRSTTGFDADLAGGLLPVVAAAISVLTAVLVIAVVGEILRHAGVAAGFVRQLDRAVPAAARRIAAAALSFSITVLGPATAHAADAPVRDWLSGSTTTTSPVATENGLLERAAPATSPPAPVSPSRAAPPVEVAPPGVRPPIDGSVAFVVVVEGDCLWSIAAGRLGPDASNHAIDDAWRAIWARNRAVIGDNPNLIFPGVHLELPPIDQPPYAAP